jgi:hypothetical protein
MDAGCFKPELHVTGIDVRWNRDDDSLLLCLPDEPLGARTRCWRVLYRAAPAAEDKFSLREDKEELPVCIQVKRGRVAF